MLAAALLSYAGLAALCLAMERHHRQLWHRAPTLQTAIVLRVLGIALLTLSLFVCVRALGGPRGVTAWFGILSIAGLGLVMLLPFAPRTVGTIALLAPMLAFLVLR